MADQYEYKAASNLNTPAQPSTQLGSAGMANIAGAAIGAYFSFQMDKIRNKMQASAVDHARDMARIGRDQNAWRSSVAYDQLREAQANEAIAMQMEEMRSRAKLQVQSENLTGPTAQRLEKVMKGQFERMEFAQESAQIAQRTAIQTQAINQSAMPQRQIVAPAQTAGDAIGSFLVDAIRIGKKAYGRDKVE